VCWQRTWLSLTDRKETKILCSCIFGMDFFWYVWNTIWLVCQCQDEACPHLMDFFLFYPFFNKYSRNESSKKKLKSVTFESRQSVQRDLQRSHANSLGVTHFHVDIGCHINPTGPTTTSDATSIWLVPPVPPQLSVSKMSHAILNGATLVLITRAFLTWLILGQNQQSLISLLFTVFL
jgi:hypothetical protein